MAETGDPFFSFEIPTKFRTQNVSNSINPSMGNAYGHRKHGNSVPQNQGYKYGLPAQLHQTHNQGSSKMVSLPYADVDSTLRGLAGQAEGFGRFAIGGLHGAIHRVTTLAGYLYFSIKNHTCCDICAIGIFKFGIGICHTVRRQKGILLSIVCLWLEELMCQFLIVMLPMLGLVIRGMSLTKNEINT